MPGASPQRARSVAGIAIDEGRAHELAQTRFFIARRKDGGALGGKWEFPGGKADEGESGCESDCESNEDALKREYLEEFGVEVEVGSLLATATFAHKEKQFLLSAYRVSLGSLDFKMTEHTEWRWVAMSEIEAMGASGDFADSDLRLLPGLRESLLIA